MTKIVKLKLDRETLRRLMVEPVRRAGAGPEGHGNMDSGYKHCIATTSWYCTT